MHATSSKENTITFKNNVVMKFKKIDEAVGSKLKLTENSERTLLPSGPKNIVWKLYGGPQKLVYNNTTLGFYSDLVNGLYFYIE